MYELKPCPFCGGRNIDVYRCWTNHSHTWLVHAKCELCGASGKMYRNPNDAGDGDYFWEHHSTKLAMEAWNKRTNDAEVTIETICAVRDHIISKCLDEKAGKVEGGYEWTGKDGKKVALIVKVVDACENT